MLNNFRRIFFENITLKQTVAKNTFWLVLAEVVAKILGLVSVIYVVRMLGATEYGKFTFAFSFVSVMSIFFGLGIADISTREFSRDKKNEIFFSGIFTLELILCLLALFIAMASSFFITPDYFIRRIMWILTIYILSSNLLEVIFSFLRARQKMEYEALIKILQAIINTIAVFFVIFYIPSAQNLSSGYMISTFILLFFVIIFFNIFFPPLRLRWEKKSLNILKMSWPLSFGFVGLWVFTLINSVMLGYFNLITENGWYSAALKIAIVASIPADLVVRSFYPILSNFFANSKEKLQKTWNYIAELMIFMAIPMVVGGIIMAPKIIDLFYGQNFMPSVFALQLLIFLVGISFVSYPFAVILIVANQQKNNFIFIISGAILIIILNFIFIPIYGFYSSIVSAIISSLAVLAAIIIFSKYKTPINPFNKEILKALLVSVLSSFVMYLVINCPLIYKFNVIFVCLLGALIYIFSLMFLSRIIFKEMIIKN